MREINHTIWMQKALELAKKGAGYVSPNPMVGCVIISEDGRLIGEGFHELYGAAHAEVNAVESVKDKSDLLSATAYITLEPCSHFGKTPPCADMLANLPLKQVILAMKDPNLQVNGKGIKKLKEAGIDVEVGLLEDEAKRLNEIFIHNQQFNKPFITLKIAQTLDGYSASNSGDSKWITNQASREYVHYLRSIYDAVLVGRETALLDNPRLTVRHIKGRQPKRLVVDGPGMLPDDLELFTDQYQDITYRITYNSNLINRSDPMLSLLSGGGNGYTTINVKKNRDGHSDLAELFNSLIEFSIYSVLVEGGSQLSTALVKENLVDKLELFIAPKILGGGKASITGLGSLTMQDAISLNHISYRNFNGDILLTGYF